MSERPSICYLLEGTGLWGGVKIVFEQAEQLAARGFDVVIASRGGQPDWYDLAVPLQTVADFGGRNLPQCDCYMGTWWPTVAPAHDTGLGIGAHLIQGYEGDFPENAPLRAKIEFLYGLKTVKLAVSPQLAQLVRERFGQPCRLVRNGIDTATFHSQGRHAPGDGPLRVAVAGQFEASTKGVPTALAAVAAARRAGHRLELVRVSQSEQSPAEAALCAADEYHRGLLPAEVGQLLRSCDLAISAANALEGFGLPAMEALASGCATLLSETPAHRGFGAAIDSGHDYARFVAHDDVEGFATALGELAADPQARGSLSDSGAKLGLRYGWDEVGAELAATMGEMLESESERWMVRNERMVPGESDLLTEQTHRQRYEFARGYAAGRRAIDAGCGVGYGSQALAESGAVSVLALDYSPEALAYARRQHDHDAIEWRQADLFEWDWPKDSADLITCFEVFEHVDVSADLVARIARALTSDGRALITTPNRRYYSPGGEPNYVHHIREYEIEEFRALLGAYFGVVEIFGQGVRGGQLAVSSAPDAAADMTFVSVCTDPRPEPEGAGLRVVAAPTWSSPEWRPLLRAWCEAFDPDDDVSLVLAAQDSARAQGEVLAELATIGADPEAIPDIVIEQVHVALDGVTRALRGAAAIVPLGARAESHERLGRSFGVEVLATPSVEALRTLRARRREPVAAAPG